ncbi:origin recognition complex subunit 2-like [Saccostrea cucullata]|uniref:origin recognition complex subunit 2-like n=1 Tax=Saccostrea cuccullata TaxID=36930 RepID=UPI002ED03DFD
MSTNSGRPRRKCVSVSFVGDDDVIGHIYDASQGKKAKPRNRLSLQHKRRSQLKYTEDIEIIERSDSDSNEENIPSAVFGDNEEENQVAGSDLFQFKTPKKSGSMAQKASEARTPKTPKSILKSSRKGSESRTPQKGEGTPTKGLQVKKKGRKPEATTPFKLRKRAEYICDDIDVDSDSSDTDSGEGESDTETTKVPPTTPRSRRKIQEAADMPHMVEEYFDLHSQGGMSMVTSDRTLAKLGSTKMDQDSLNELLKRIPSKHSSECKQMYEEHRELFSRWMFHMCNGYNILLHGLGSKRTLIEDFRRSELKDVDHIVVNGYFPSLTIKHILNTIIDDILEVEGSHRSPLDQVDFIKSQFETKDYRDFFLIVHNIDGVMLRPEKVQNILSLLSQIRGFHIIASIDHINAPLIWDQTKCSRYCWLWYDVTTYLPYTDETSYENSLLVQQTGALALSSMSHVMKSLTTNAKQIFILLAKHQMENKDSGTYIGMSLQDLYQRCREAFLVNSDLTLRAQLTEFRDHKLIKSKKGFEGIEYLVIPVDNATLTEFIEQHDSNV